MTVQDGDNFPQAPIARVFTSLKPERVLPNQVDPERTLALAAERLESIPSRKSVEIASPRAPPNSPVSGLVPRISFGAVSTGDESPTSGEVEKLPEEFSLVAPCRFPKREGARCPSLDHPRAN